MPYDDDGDGGVLEALEEHIRSADGKSNHDDDGGGGRSRDLGGGNALCTE